MNTYTHKHTRWSCSHVTQKHVKGERSDNKPLCTNTLQLHFSNHKQPNPPVKLCYLQDYPGMFVNFACLLF